jgi:hypothetical protein
MQLWSSFRFSLWNAIAFFKSMLEMTSPLIKTNGSLRITPMESNSRNASPADKHALLVMHLTLIVDGHFELFKYVCSMSACHTQNTNSSSTPFCARNSIVYSNMGTFTSGNRTLGTSHVTGRKVFVKLSASKMACSFCSRCSCCCSPPFSFFPLAALGPLPPFS